MHDFGMVKIRLHRDPAPDADDERDPYVLTISRVPCVGEEIHAAGSNDGRKKRGPGYYVVTRVVHDAGFGDGLAARVYAREVTP